MITGLNCSYKPYAIGGTCIDLREIQDKVIVGDAQAIRGHVRDGLAEGASPQMMISGYPIPAMTEVGGRLQRGDFFLPEMLAAPRAMQTWLHVPRPLLVGEELETVARMVVGTVKADLHDIGKNLVHMMFERAGFDAVDLGIDVALGAFVEAVARDRPEADIARDLRSKIKAQIGITVYVQLADYRSLPRTEKKTKRVFDSRHL